MAKFVVALIFIFLSFFGLTQNTTARLTIESGSSVYFNINSFTKYQNGLDYSNWTRLRVYFIDTTALGAVSNKRWRITVEAMAGNIQGDAGNTLNLNTIELQAICADATGKGIVALPIPGSPIELLDLGTNNVNASLVQISYYCGQSLTVANNLLGQPADYYFVDIVYTLEGDPATSP
ncbi:MAG: hypothetical protein GY756_11890 [bacterium]|nr:hypothetical protein [bacterium]